MIGLESRLLIEDYGYTQLGDISDPFIWTGSDTVQETVDKHNLCDRVVVKLINGIEVVCSPEQGFVTRAGKKRQAVISAENLEQGALVRLNQTTPYFSHIRLQDSKYLSKLTAFDFGVLVGLFRYLSGDGKVLDIPVSRNETWKALDYLLGKLTVSYEKERYYKRAYRVKYLIDNDEFLEELKPYLIPQTVPDIFWTSKDVWQGFLKVAFSFSIVSTRMFTIRSEKDSSFLKHVQQALMLFGVNSTYSSGLRASQLMIFNASCYKLASKIGAFNAERFFEGIDFTKFLGYTKLNTIQSTYSKVSRVEKLEPGSLYKVSGQQLMVNGVILENYE